jgi:protein SFI1
MVRPVDLNLSDADLNACVVDMAVSFSLRANSVLAASTVRHWARVLSSLQQARLLADQYRATQLKYQMLIIWRLALRRKHKAAKQARLAEKHLVVRRTWTKWRERVEQRKREHKMKEFEQRKVRKIFSGE